MSFEKLPKSTEGHLIETDLPIIRDILKITNPISILEIGLNAGHSSYFWLSESNANITSVDICIHSYAVIAAAYLNKLFPNRFTFYPVDSKKCLSLILENKYDLIFIDGEHSEQGITNDIYIAKELNIPYIFIDDYNNIIERVSNTLLGKENIIKTYLKGKIPKALFKNKEK